MTPPYSRPTTPAVFPLVLAGAAFVMTAWLAWERFRPVTVHVEAEPRAIEPRGELADFEKTTIGIFERAAPSVVHITSLALVRRGWSQGVSEGAGTGFVWDDHGYVVTNYHVIQSLQSEIVVRFQGLRESRAVVVGGEEMLDIAVIKVLDAPSGLPPIELGSSKDLRVGQSVFAIGNPFGLDHSLTTGVVSALDREIETEKGTPIQGAIQVDAAINPGNSGGPLLDSAGRLIGMNTSIVSPSRASAGIGFAIPVDTINRVVPRLIRGDLGTRPALGVRTRMVRMPDGAVHPIVVSVDPGTGAEEAGVVGSRPDGYGDVIVSIDGSEVNSFDDLITILDQKELGQTVRVKLLRHRGGDGSAFEPIEVDVPLKIETQRRRD